MPTKPLWNSRYGLYGCFCHHRATWGLDRGFDSQWHIEGAGTGRENYFQNRVATLCGYNNGTSAHTLYVIGHKQFHSDWTGQTNGAGNGDG